MVCEKKNISSAKDIENVKFRGIEMKTPDTPANTPPVLTPDDMDPAIALDQCLTEDEDAN